MRRVVTVADVEAAAEAGSSLVVDDHTIVTPLARDRAAALGVSLGGASTSAGMAESKRAAPSGAGGGDVRRLALESRVRIVARRMLLARGEGLGGLEELVAAVMARLGCGCGCEHGGDA